MFFSNHAQMVTRSLNVCIRLCFSTPAEGGLRPRCRNVHIFFLYLFLTLYRSLIKQYLLLESDHLKFAAVIVHYLIKQTLQVLKLMISLLDGMAGLSKLDFLKYSLALVDRDSQPTVTGNILHDVFTVKPL